MTAPTAERIREIRAWDKEATRPGEKDNDRTDLLAALDYVRDELEKFWRDNDEEIIPYLLAYLEPEPAP